MSTTVAEPKKEETKPVPAKAEPEKDEPKSIESKDEEDLGGLDDQDDDQELTLKSSDNVEFKMSRKTAMQSALIQTMWEGGF
jgi:hypothetical protein